MIEDHSKHCIIFEKKLFILLLFCVFMFWTCDVLCLYFSCTALNIICNCIFIGEIYHECLFLAFVCKCHQGRDHVCVLQNVECLLSEQVSE